MAAAGWHPRARKAAASRLYLPNIQADVGGSTGDRSNALSGPERGSKLRQILPPLSSASRSPLSDKERTGQVNSHTLRLLLVWILVRRAANSATPDFRGEAKSGHQAEEATDWPSMESCMRESFCKRCPVSSSLLI